MNKTSAITAVVLISTVISTTTYGEGAAKVLQPRGYPVNPGVVRNPAPTQRVVAPVQSQQTQSNPGGMVLPPQRVVRKVASVSDTSYGKVRVRKNSYFIDDRATDMRFSITGGLSNLTSGVAEAQQAREDINLKTNYLVGIGADVRFQRYFGIELDAYYGIAPIQTIQFDDEEVQKKKLQHMGGMFNVKGQYPTYVSNVRLIPKLGAGYGLLKLNQTTESQALADTYETSETLKGVYGTVGLDIEPTSWMILTFDYAKSLMASGTFSLKSSSASGDTELADPQFDRMRVGLLFRVHPNVLIGGNYTKRSLKFSAETDDPNAFGSDAGSPVNLSNSESLSQFGGTLMLQF